MSDMVISALITAGASALVAITALLLNYRGFAAIDSRFASLDNRFASLERRMERLEEGNKEFFKWFGRLEAGIGRIKDHIGLKG